MYLWKYVFVCVYFFWWVLQHCTGFAGLVWGTLRVHRAFIYSNWFVCSVCFCSLLLRLTFLLSFLDILHCLPSAVGVPLESALNLVSPMSPCWAHDTHACCARIIYLNKKMNTYIKHISIYTYIYVFIYIHVYIYMYV